MVAFTATGIHNPKVGLIHRQMSAHQGQDAAKHDCLQLGAVAVGQKTARELFLVVRGINATDDTDSPVLKWFGDRGDRMVAHLNWIGRLQNPLLTVARAMHSPQTGVTEIR